jgi:cysteine synthase A
MSAGTGGTSATIGRYIRYRNLATRLCVVDVEHSVFYDAYCTGDLKKPARRGRASKASVVRASSRPSYPV